MNKIVEPNNNIDWQDFHVLWKTEELVEKWLKIIDRNSGTIFWPNFVIDVFPEDSPFHEEVSFGTIFEPGSGWSVGKSYQLQELTVLEIDDTGQWLDVEITHTSKVYRIKHSLVKDCLDNLIPSGDIGLHLTLNNPTFKDVYDEFAVTSKGLTITDIGNSTGLSRNTVFRVCKNFVFHQWLRREKDKSYTVIEPEEFNRRAIKFFDDSGKTYRWAD